MPFPAAWSKGSCTLSPPGGGDACIGDTLTGARGLSVCAPVEASCMPGTVPATSCVCGEGARLGGCYWPPSSPRRTGETASTGFLGTLRLFFRRKMWLKNNKKLLLQVAEIRVCNGITDLSIGYRTRSPSSLEAAHHAEPRGWSFSGICSGAASA
jgi:hypothetical protein